MAPASRIFVAREIDSPERCCLFGHALVALGQVKERGRRAAPAILISKLETSLASGIVATLTDHFFRWLNSGGLREASSMPKPKKESGLLKGSQEIARFTPSSWTFSSAAEFRTTRGVHSACTCKHAPACTADERWELSSSFRCRAIDWAG